MNILEYIKNKRIFFAGATGTELIKLGMKPNESSSEWNLSHPEEMIEVHRSYLEAGANAFTASTFTANSLNYPDKTELRELIVKAFELSRTAIQRSGRRDVFLGLNIGPLGSLLEPLGPIKKEDAEIMFAELADLAQENKADFVLVETMNEYEEARIALETIKKNTSLPVILSFSFSKFGKLLNGETVEDCVKMAERLSADVVGANCSFGPDQLYEIAKRIKSSTDLPVLIEPNAGLPMLRGTRLFYDVDADDFAKTMADIAALGVECLGGCCGTTPEYIKKMVQRINEDNDKLLV